MSYEMKSPLKARPLRMPGQSIDEQITSIREGEALVFVLIPLVLILLTLWSWLAWLGVLQPTNPLLLTLVTVIITVYSGKRLYNARKRLRLLNQGRDGELAVGQMLSRLERLGCRVYHDIMGEDFNIDHVIVSTYGVFSVETKTYSKPAKGECRIIVDEQGLKINGYAAGTKTLKQVAAQKSWLERLISSHAGISASVQPVIAYPGWYIEDRRKDRSKIWVLEPKALRAFIEKSPRVLSDSDVRIISNGFSRYIRSTNTRLSA